MWYCDIPAAAEAVPQECVLVDVVGVGSDLCGSVVHLEQVAPLSPEHGLHPGRGDYAVWNDGKVALVQGVPLGCSLPFVAILTKVMSQYRLLLLIWQKICHSIDSFKCNFQFDVNKG